MGDVFILGAGFSQAVFCGMPLLADLSLRVGALAQSPASRRASSTPLFAGNVELLLDYLCSRQPWHSEEETLSNRAAFLMLSRAVADTVSEAENHSFSTAPPEWVVGLVRAWHDHRAQVLSLNYDTIVERVACSSLEQIVEPHLWRLPVCRGIARTSMVFGGTFPATLRLLKLHGSTNWYYSGNFDNPGDQIYYVAVPRSGDDKREEARQLDEEHVRDKVPLVIPPVATKTGFYANDTLRLLWHDAARAVSAADRVFLIGYSLPATDLTLRYLLGTNTRARSGQVHVVNPDVGIERRLFDGVFDSRNWTAGSDFVGGLDCVQRFAEWYAASGAAGGIASQASHVSEGRL
ncbi:hypothetical protein LLH23_11620 [bacterium]|nr:hypothetical protein [bacterium]